MYDKADNDILLKASAFEYIPTDTETIGWVH